MITDILYTVVPSNSHQVLVLDKSGIFEWSNILSRLNRTPQLASWDTPTFSFKSVDKNTVHRPNITVSSSLFAIRADLKNSLFPEHTDNFEFLPAKVDDENWLIINCLKTVSATKEDDSQLLRGLTNQIYLIIKVTVVDPLACQFEAFTLSDSNRSQLIIRSNFYKKFQRSDLEGVEFKQIGLLSCGKLQNTKL